MPDQEPRHQITALCFAATFVAYMERVGFSIAYTAMARQAGISEAVKGSVLSAFYWGYGLSQVGALLPPLAAVFCIVWNPPPWECCGQYLATTSERRDGGHGGHPSDVMSQ